MPWIMEETGFDGHTGKNFARFILAFFNSIDPKRPFAARLLCGAAVAYEVHGNTRVGSLRIGVTPDKRGN